MHKCKTNLKLMGRSNLNLPVNFFCSECWKSDKLKYPPNEKEYQLLVTSNNRKNGNDQKEIPTSSIILTEFLDDSRKTHYCSHTLN